MVDGDTSPDAAAHDGASLERIHYASDLGLPASIRIPDIIASFDLLN